jgi:hypothetical protein
LVITIIGDINMTSGVYERTPKHSAALSKGQRNSDVVKAKNEAQKGVPRTPEACAAISAAKKGVPHTPEHNSAISAAQKGVPKTPRTPEHSAAISKAKMGVPLSPEHCAAIKNSDATKANADAQRGGHDIVEHHYLYDHSDLSLNTVGITRSNHMKLHKLLQKLGYVIPHINIKEI